MIWKWTKRCRNRPTEFCVNTAKPQVGGVYHWGGGTSSVAKRPHFYRQFGDILLSLATKITR